MVRRMSTRVLLVGGGGREDAVARKLSQGGAEIYSVLKNSNPSIISVSSKHLIHDELDFEEIASFALENKVELAFIGPDPVLETPLADKLVEMGIKVASPSRSAARIETSKAFMRDFMERNRIPGNVEFKVFDRADLAERFIMSSGKDYAIKPLGLTGGKGVRVMGVHLANREEACSYAGHLIEKYGKVLIEDRISGEEFSLQVLSDGRSILPFPLVQDYKRAYEGDKGPNTGGMGAISDSDGSLPFISRDVASQARTIMEKIASAMSDEGIPFKGVMYGQFMQVEGEAKIVEVNARFADPEGINVLSILEDSLLELLEEVADGKLRKTLNFRHEATVLKYVVPVGYGSDPKPGELRISEKPLPENFMIYYAAVSGTINAVKMGTSRSLALVGFGGSIPEASKAVEDNLWRIEGPYYMRHDIGTEEMLRSKSQ